MPTLCDFGGPDDSDQGDTVASDPEVVEWDDKDAGRQVYVFVSVDELREQVRKLARLNTP